MKTQLMVYLEINDLITIDQSAYRQQHNTQTAWQRVIDDWLCNMSDGNLTGVCSFDIRTCFDTINHSILLKKKKKKKKNVYFDRMFLVRRPTIKAYNEAASMQVT